MFANLLRNFKRDFNLVRQFSSAVRDVVAEENNTVVPKQLLYPAKYQKPRQVWLENLDTIDEKKLGLLELHPHVFAQAPRIDIIHQNVRWQKNYRFVSYAHTKLRFEVRGGGRKPWPQKGFTECIHAKFPFM